MQILAAHPMVETRSVAAVRGGVAMFSGPIDFAPTTAADAFHMVVRGVAIQDMRLTAVSTTGHRITVTDTEHATLLLPLRGRIATHDGRRQVVTSGESIAFPRPGSRTTEPAPDYLGLVVQMPIKRLQAELVTGGGGGWPWPESIPALRGPGAALRRHVRHMVDQVDADPTVFAGASRSARGAAAMLFDLLADSLTAPVIALPASAAQVARAEAFARAHLDTPLRVADMAEAAGVSLRSLQMAFQTLRGRGPRQFIETCRLDLARERLRLAAPGQNVTAILLDCGVTHLSRFAGHYRARFGETPVETLRRAMLGPGRG